LDRDQIALSNSEERYVVLPVVAQCPDSFPPLIQSHSNATLSFATFGYQMQSLESKLRCLIPKIVFSYVQSFQKQFRHVIEIMRRKADGLSAIEASNEEAIGEVSCIDAELEETRTLLMELIPEFLAHFADP
jgi:hypothetical protein